MIIFVDTRIKWICVIFKLNWLLLGSVTEMITDIYEEKKHSKNGTLWYTKSDLK